MYEKVLAGLTLLVAFSGWFKVLYDYWIAKPKIKGRLLYVNHGPFTVPNSDARYSFILYPYLVNSGKNAVHILDYELSINFEVVGWKRMSRVYGKFNGLTVTIPEQGGPHHLVIKDEHLIYQKNEMLQSGAPVHGWAPFVCNSDLAGRKVIEYKFVCVDAYGKRHVLRFKKGAYFNPLLLQEMADIRLSRHPD